MLTGPRLCSAMSFFVISGRSDSRIRWSHLANAMRLRSAAAPSPSAIGFRPLAKAFCDAIAKNRPEVTRLQLRWSSRSEKQSVVVLDPEQDASGHFPRLERYHRMLVGGRGIAQ